MTDPSSLDPSRREIPLTAGGELEVRLGGSRLRIRTGQPDRVIVTASQGHDLDREFEIVAASGLVRILDGGSGTFRLGPLALRSGRAPDLDIEVPAGVRLSVRTVSGDIESERIDGPSRWTTITGGLRLALASGPVVVETVSGATRIVASTPIAVTTRTVSGNIRVRAPRVLALDVATTSGSVEIEGELDASGVHAVTSVSGAVHFATSSEVRLETQSVAGDLKASGTYRSEGSRGRRTVVVGAGRVRVSVRTMSGDVHLRAMKTGDAPADWATPDTGDPVAARGHVSWAPAAVAPTPTPAAQDAAALAAQPDVETARMDILRALERGDLDVETAWSRLDALESRARPAAAAW